VSGLRVVVDPTPESEQLGFNNDKAPLNNVDVREALTYAVPYSQILKSVVFGYGSLFKGEFLPDMPGYSAPIQRPYSEDLTKARQLLAKSGLKLPLHFAVTVDSGDDAASEIMPILQNDWSNIGVDITIDTLSPTDYTNVIEGHSDTAYVRLDGPGVPEPGYYLDYDSKCAISENLTQMCVPKVDSLLTAARSVAVSKQQQYWNLFDKLLIADYPKIQLYDFYSPEVLSTHVKSFEYTDEIGGLQDWSIS
jgi:peptide/nickel transport system substrate-binding protein